MNSVSRGAAAAGVAPGAALPMLPAGAVAPASAVAGPGRATGRSAHSKPTDTIANTATEAPATAQGQRRGVGLVVACLSRRASARAWRVGVGVGVRGWSNQLRMSADISLALA